VVYKSLYRLAKDLNKIGKTRILKQKEKIAENYKIQKIKEKK
jgi:hypothetical protein